tara:strand:- start:115 stop:501 length:387 start_codon:yes stop_codon:yes gene_type:complete
MTTVISEQIKNFTHVNIRGNESNINITIKKKQYENKSFWLDITVITKLSNGSILTNHNFNDISNPFLDMEHVKKGELYNGEIIACNSLTEKMVEYILMDDKDLSKYTGRTTPMDYRINLLSGILLLWD